MYNKALLKKQIEDSCQVKSEDKNVCTICKNSGHTKDSCFHKPKGGVVASITDMEICPIFKESLLRKVLLRML